MVLDVKIDGENEIRYNSCVKICFYQKQKYSKEGKSLWQIQL